MIENENIYIREAQKGDSESFAVIYKHYVPQIYRFIFFRVSSKTIAEDLTHESFLSAWKSIGSYTQKNLSISSWLYRIARNKVIDHYRTNKKNTSIDTENFNENIIGFYEQEDPDIKLNINKITSLINLLKTEYKEVIIMKFIEDLSHKEIAEALDKSEGAIRLIQHRAIKSLKELYARSRKNN
ncbi:RNA polymerase sigma factor [Patescibacteria group bacterium]|nr:RNA polymerase sigma factor [Patescibacteria group bacterium]